MYCLDFWFSRGVLTVVKPDSTRIRLSAWTSAMLGITHPRFSCNSHCTSSVETLNFLNGSAQDMAASKFWVYCSRRNLSLFVWRLFISSLYRFEIWQNLGTRIGRICLMLRSRQYTCGNNVAYNASLLMILILFMYYAARLCMILLSKAQTAPRAKQTQMYRLDCCWHVTETWHQRILCEPESRQA